jgi:hypothetical protein
MGEPRRRCDVVADPQLWQLYCCESRWRVQPGLP